MEDNAIVEQFEAIEKRVETLIRVCGSLEAANAELKNRIDTLEEELREKTEAENSYRAERDLIRNRIDKLLTRLADVT